MKYRQLLVTLFLLMSALAGCSNGGSGNSLATQPLSSAPGKATFESYLQEGHSTTLDARTQGYNATSYQLKLNELPIAGATNFYGLAPAYRTTDTLNMYKKGALLSSSVTTHYYFLNPYVPLGDEISTGLYSALVTSSFSLPDTLKIGTSGPLKSLTLYSNCNSAPNDYCLSTSDPPVTWVDAFKTVTYSVEANDPKTLLMCVNTVVSDVTKQGTADGLADSTETDCFSVDASGKMALVTVAKTVDGTLLKFK